MAGKTRRSTAVVAADKTEDALVKYLAKLGSDERDCLRRAIRILRSLDHK